MIEIDSDDIRLVCYDALAFDMGLTPKEDRTEEDLLAIPEAAHRLLGIVNQ